MKKLFALFCLTGSLLLGAYKTGEVGALPEEVAPAVKEAMKAEGTQLLDESGNLVSEIWFRKAVPAGETTSEQDATIEKLPHGSMIGVIRFPQKAADRRGQVIDQGVYTLRYALHPIDGAHQGVAYQRDFFLMVPAGMDKEPDKNMEWAELIAASKKASGTAHPAVLEAWKDDAPEAGPLEVMEGRDWVLHAKVGELPVAVILVGKTPH